MKYFIHVHTTHVLAIKIKYTLKITTNINNRK